MFEDNVYIIPEFNGDNFFKPCTTIDTSHCCNCIEASNTTPTLRETLQFIKTHPSIIDGELVEVSILLKTSLLTDQDSGPQQPVQVTESTVHGHIHEVCETYVVIKSDNGCEDKQEYIIPYSKIIQVVHPSIGAYFGEYVSTMNNLPGLCCSKNSEELNLLCALANTIKKHYLSQDKGLALIIDGIQTTNFPVSAYCVIKNLIIVEGFFVIPITKISGFVLNPICNG